MSGLHKTMLFAALCLMICADSAAQQRAKNVVLMVADGAGFNSWKATAMFEGSVGHDFHDEEGWVTSALSTHGLRQHQASPVSPEHGLTQLPSLVYDPLRVWDSSPAEGGGDAYPYYFAGYRWLRLTAPDSANTMSAMVTGVKSYAGSVNFDGAGQPVADTVAALAHKASKRVGVVSSVPFTHATPAAGAGTHQPMRHKYCDLALEMLTAPYPDVIAGCGNPDFDNNGDPVEDETLKSYAYVGGKEIWQQLNGSGHLDEGQMVCAEVGEDDSAGIALTVEHLERLASWTLVQSRKKIESLQKGDTPRRLLIVPEVGSTAMWGGVAHDPEQPYAVRVGGTLQQQRGSRARPEYTDPGYDPQSSGVPSLESMTRVALNALDDDEDGFFLHVEGGAVDWAMHQNQLGRMVEELQEFKRAVAAVVDWVENHGGWDETLLIVTADHDHMLWGPNSHQVPFDPLQDNGAGRLPSYRWLSDSHSNSLVPLFARGVGAERFNSLANSEDPFYGPYADQTDVFDVMRSVIGD